MKAEKNGGPAFPHGEFLTPVEFGDGRKAARFHHSQAGMSLRDWFAGQALAGLATSYEVLLSNRELMREFGTDGIHKLQAIKSYKMADAMLSAREKGTK